FFQAEDGIRDRTVTGVQTCALPISFCQIRSASREFEVTTFRLAQAIALDRSLGKIDINLSHLGQRSRQFSGKKILSAHLLFGSRSEERRVGKECRSGCARSDEVK